MDLWRTLPPLPALRAFAAWAETGSMTAAGARLNVTHAAVSQQVRALERHLGLALIERAGGRAALTPEGRVLAEAVAAGFGQIARAVVELTGAEADRPLWITTSPTFAASWLMPRLGRFRARHPEIDMMIDPTPALRQLEPGGIDLAIRYGEGRWPGLAAQELMRAALVVAAAPALLPRQGAAVPDLAALPWLQELGTDEATEFLRRHGLARTPGHGLTVLPGNLILEALRAGQGLAVMSRSAIEADLATGRLVALFEDPQPRAYWLVHRTAPLRPAAAGFARWILAEARRLPPA